MEKNSLKKKTRKETLAIKIKCGKHLYIKMKNYSVHQKKPLNEKIYLQQTDPAKDSYWEDRTLEKRHAFQQENGQKISKAFHERWNPNDQDMRRCAPH